MIDIAGLKKNVGFLNWALGTTFLLGLAAIITSYVMLSGQIGDRYDRVGDKLDGIATQISDLRVDITEVRANGVAQRGDTARKD